MASKTTFINEAQGGGQFTPESGGQFAPDLGGQVRPESGGQIERIFQLSILKSFICAICLWIFMGKYLGNIHFMGIFG